MSFLDDNFLLTNEPAKKLYHEHAKKMPIIDYHCHLEPKDIYENKNYPNLTRVWLNDGMLATIINGDWNALTAFLKI